MAILNLEEIKSSALGKPHEFLRIISEERHRNSMMAPNVEPHVDYSMGRRHADADYWADKCQDNK